MNLRIILSFASACLLTFSAFAQQSIEVIYKWDIHHKVEKPVTDTGFVMLNIMDDKAIVQDYSLFRLDSIRGIANTPAEVIAKYEKENGLVQTYFEPIILQDLTNQKYKIVEAIVPEIYRYEEPFIQNWTMLDEPATIGGYNCSAATISYGGRTWKVWYTEDIPVPAGPWKLAGLPGLILRAEESEGEFAFDLAELRNGNGVKSILPDNKSITKGSRDQIVQMRNKVMVNPMKNLPMEALTHVTVTKGPGDSRMLSVNGVILRQPKNGYVAIEKE